MLQSLLPSLCHADLEGLVLLYGSQAVQSVGGQAAVAQHGQTAQALQVRHLRLEGQHVKGWGFKHVEVGCRAGSTGAPQAAR